MFKITGWPRRIVWRWRSTDIVETHVGWSKTSAPCRGRLRTILEGQPQP